MVPLLIASFMCHLSIHISSSQKKEPKNFITDMGSTEIFELYETSSKRQGARFAPCARKLELFTAHAANSCSLRNRIDEHLSDFNIIGTEELVQEYEQKFEELLDDQKLSKLCSDAGF